MSVAVIGAGAWGTALAKQLTDVGEDVTLWCREPDVVASIRKTRINETFLPDVELPKELLVTGTFEEALRDVELILLAVPSQFIRAVVTELLQHVNETQRFVSATKGIEETSLLRMSQVIHQLTPFAAEVAVISGPTFAKEVARGEPTALVVASRHESFALEVQKRLASSRFRLYSSDDVIGVELGGALKNVIAVASGVATGLGLGANPKAALMARGLAEISRLAVAMGGKRETLLGLSGMGDLVLTCTGDLSRNRTVGVALGKGKSLKQILSSMEQVAEGVRTTAAAAALARRQYVEMPIVFQMERLLNGELDARQAMEELLERPLKAE